MKKILFITGLFCCCVGFLSFLLQPINGPKEKLKAFYATRFQQLVQAVSTLQAAVTGDSGNVIIHEQFFQARLAYKQLEPMLEYYFQGDVKYFNGLAVNFVEEEDPSAAQEPQGFQMIESLIYPDYTTGKKEQLLLYIGKLENIVRGMAGNAALFEPGEYVPDAVMEELYRILALGITGFDSPIAKISLPETEAAITSLQVILDLYRETWMPLQPATYLKVVKTLDSAIGFLHVPADFDSFDRMTFIHSFINPLCDAMGILKMKAGNKEAPLHDGLIKRKANLFASGSLDVNRYFYEGASNKLRIALGKKLFYEPLLSVNSKRSCASCHQPGKAFTDGLPRALQLDGHSTLPRNTPTLWNASLQMNLFYDSRHGRPEDVIMEVLGNEKEMNSAAGAAVQKLKLAKGYRDLFRAAYGSNDNSITEQQVANAIALYTGTLVSYNSRFDKYMRGGKNNLSKAEVQGFNLFVGKAKCATCHYVPLFNGSKPPSYYYQESEVLGVPASTGMLHPQLDADPGRFAILKWDFFNNAFKTPTLRNVALTAPYMHNGIYKTLEEVIDFYDKGGGQGLGLDIPNQTLPADKLMLTAVEKKQLKGFLLTLTDTSTAKKF